MENRQLLYFTRIVTLGSFTKAAAETPLRCLNSCNMKSFRTTIRLGMVGLSIVESRKGNKEAKATLHVCAVVMVFAMKMNPQGICRLRKASKTALVGAAEDGLGQRGPTSPLRGGRMKAAKHCQPSGRIVCWKAVSCLSARPGEGGAPAGFPLCAGMSGNLVLRERESCRA